MIHAKAGLEDGQEEEEEEPTTILNLLFFVSPWSLTKSGLCAATNNVSRQKPLTRIYICDGLWDSWLYFAYD